MTDATLRFARRHAVAPHGAAPGHDEDPLAGIANLFDVSVAFIVALLIALFALFSAGTLLDPRSNVTIVKQDDSGQLEIITKEGEKVTIQKSTDRSMSGQGVKLGTAYRLAGGQVIYVPDQRQPAP